MVYARALYLGLIALLLATAACKGQVPPNPTVLSCPASTGTAYTPLNQSSPATGTTYTDTKPPAGSYCYVAQSVLGSAVSNPSNTAGPFTLSGSNSTDLTWTDPTSGSTPSGYVLSRAPAVSSSVLAPTLGTGSVAREVKPALPGGGGNSAAPAAPVLTAKVVSPARLSGIDSSSR